mmetsp:Transcript_13558/g.25878  ORF Transcript_13558/g.25878 Transcript_13558/m.25878 type:complete len:156 (-) Transcript_13558:105-572(-)|eukprot:scaffold10074_cov176-Amphora_coffeaeformis.AAC.2
MMELHFETIARVLESWDAARRNCKNFESNFGHLFINRFVELQPRVKKHYGFQKDTSLGEMMMNKHAEGIVGFFDSVLQLLGPDVEFIEEILYSVGKRHSKMGVCPGYFPYLGTALFYALEETLGPSNWSPEDQTAWEEVYEMISNEMVKAILEDT